MKKSCSSKCVKAYNMMKETSLIAVVKDFVDNAINIENNPEIVQQFYDYVRAKYKIPCETGMLFIEKITMVAIYDKVKIKVGSINQMVNDKLKLYKWIRPIHLGIEKMNTNHTDDSIIKQINKKHEKMLINNLKLISKSDLPSVKIYHLMDFINELYKKIGRDVGHDAFFPYLIYFIIKAEVEDIYAHLVFIKTFRRNYESDCNFGCNHGFSIQITCDCLISSNWNSEIDYYITTSLAAVDFISKLEYYNLKVNFQEFEREIISRMSKIKIDNTTEKDKFFEVEY